MKFIEHKPEKMLMKQLIEVAINRDNHLLI